MITFVARGSSVLPSLTATTQAVPSLIRPIIPGVVETAQNVLNQPPPDTTTNNSLKSLLPQGSRLNTIATNGLSTPAQVRLAHTDMQVPDFSFYRRDSVKDNAKSSDPSSSSRKAFTYMMMAGGTIPTAYAAKTVVSQFVSTWNASADVLALAKIEVKLSDIPEGKNATFKWRNKPLFIRHRGEAEIEKERGVNVAELRDPQHDDERVQKPEWLVLLGVCTHLGCVPIANSGDYGGYYCPCHGSHYDASGRIRKGPAPLNLEIPEYSFPDEDTIIVG